MLWPENRITRSILFTLIDCIAICASLLSAVVFRRYLPFFDQSLQTPFEPYISLLPLGIILTIMAFFFSGLYRNPGQNIIDKIPSIIGGVLLSSLILMAITFTFRTYPYSRIIILLNGLLLGFYVFLWRYIYYRVFQNSRVASPLKSIAIIANPDDLNQVLINTSSSFEFIGFLSDIEVDSHMSRLGKISDLERILESNDVKQVFISSKTISGSVLTHLLLTYADRGIHFYYQPDIDDILLNSAVTIEMSGTPYLLIDNDLLRFKNVFLKRIMDLTLSLSLVVIFSPIMIMTFFIVLFDRKHPGPVLYRQERVGKNGTRFMLYKFRSMINSADNYKNSLASQNQADGPLFKIQNDPRITPVGKFLRRWSIDELPQLFNVIFDEMSLVGPRPPLVQEYQQYVEEEKARLNVLPGMTGLWQINGRSNLTFKDMIRYDLYYIEHWSIWLDIKILIKTISAVVKAKGAY